ncbi:MAG: hypothetical protein OXC07_00230 [Kistimonas sp.]|nr:hypothetical protein [Kistimonas sp.]
MAHYYGERLAQDTAPNTHRLRRTLSIERATALIADAPAVFDGSRT